MSRVLPIDLDPPIKVYTTHAYQLSIASRHEHFMPWFCSNYIQLMCFKDFSFSPYTPINFPFGTVAWDFNVYCSMPLIDRQMISRRTLDDVVRTDIVEFLKRGIDAGQYGYLHVNDYYIEGRPDWQFTHEILVFGYDDDAQTLQAAAYFGMHYTSRSIPYEAFRQAYASLEPEPRFQPIYLLSLSTNAFMRADPRTIRHEMLSFLQGETIHVESELGKLRNPRGVQVFGIRCYRYMRANADRYAVRDIRPIHLLWEHKKGMQLRLEYLKGQGLIDASEAETIGREFGAMADQLQSFRNLQFKSRMRANNDLESVLLRMLYEVEEREFELFRRMIAALEPAALPFGAYMQRVLDTSEMSLTDLARLAGVETGQMEQLLRCEAFPWDLEAEQVRAIAEGLGISQPLLGQLLVNYDLDPMLHGQASATGLDEISVSRTVVEQDRRKAKFLEQLTGFKLV